MANSNKNAALAVIDNDETTNALAGSIAQREVAEAQSMMLVAKRFPRDTVTALNRILNACTRPKLAEVATYAYVRGGVQVTGPSIRLAEAIAQNWGNMTCGVREIEQVGIKSVCEAFAWDLETNTRVAKTFVVPHIRTAFNKETQAVEKKVLTDPRDIYEMVANQGARRLRACILAIVPGDVVDEAIDQCEKTLASNDENVSDESKAKLLKAFAEFGVGIADLQAYLQCAIHAVTPQQVVRLRQIYASLHDGFGKPEDFFKTMVGKGKAPESASEQAGKQSSQKKSLDAVKAALGGRKGKAAAKRPEPQPEAQQPQPAPQSEAQPEQPADGGVLDSVMGAEDVEDTTEDLQAVL